MRAAEAFWMGRYELFDTLIEKNVPACISGASHLSASVIKYGGYREGHGYLGDVVDDYVLRIRPYHDTWKMAMELDSVAQEATDRSAEAVQRLEKMLDSFRARVRNDLASIKAASDRVQSEVAQMEQKYSAARDLLVSPEFERAIANAERMADALLAISQLSETRLSVAVFSGGTSNQPGST